MASSFASLVRAAARIACAVAFTCGLGGCAASVHEYQVAGYAAAPRDSSRPIVATPIVAEGEHLVVLGIGGTTEYVDTAYRRLLAQCPGEIIGLNTRFSTSLRFFYYKDRVHIQALCVR